MLTRRVALLQQCSRIKTIYSRKSTKAKLDQTELAFPEKFKLPIPKPRIKKIEPVMKNFFLGKIDEDIMTYPEPQSDHRTNEFNEWLKRVEDYVKTIDGGWVYKSPSFSAEMREKLNELGVNRGRIPYDYDGLDLLESEYLRLVEVLSTVPKLGINFLECNNYPVELLKQEGTIEQKNKYLRLIATGHCTPVICANEGGERIDPQNISTVATLSHDEKTWSLRGQKIFVQQDNNANLFIVYALARVGGDRRRTSETLSAFIVDKSLPGVGELIPVKSPWLGSENMFSVNFNEVVIPYENIIGEVGGGVKSLERYFTEQLHFWAGIYITTLKTFLNSMINHVIRYDIHERESVKQVISNTSMSIYAMESIAYLTTSLGDLYEGQDLVAEQAATKLFCSTECINRLIDGFKLLDTHLCASTFPFEQVMRNQVFGLHGNSDLKTYVGLIGIQHAGPERGLHVRKMRNPFYYPHYVVKKILGYEKTFPKLHLQGNLHPSFQNYVVFLDESIGRMKDNVNEILIRFGAETVTHEMDLQRLTEMATLIYATTACFGRASRSYCIGLANSDFEVYTSVTFGYHTYMRIKHLYEEINDGDSDNGNISHSRIAQRSYDLKKYVLENPLMKNW